MKEEHDSTTFSVAFLDVMCCGFGAVILLVMILNGKTLQKRQETHENLQSQVERVTRLKEYADAHLAELNDEARALELAEGDLQVRAEMIRSQIADVTKENKAAAQEAEAQQQEIEATERRIALLEEVRKARAERMETGSPGDRLVGYSGDGRRQYLTGLKLGGERTLVLVDASASMLDETIVNIVRRKLMDESIRRRAPKWMRAVRSAHWSLVNLQEGKKFQVYRFAEEAEPLLQGTEGQWLDVGDPDALDKSIANLRSVAPDGGTNLSNAFKVINQMNPKPDSVLLLTDGLPTLGGAKKAGGSISGADREKLFNAAAASVPAGVPINVLLFPIEGDPAAAASFWKLAIDTRGSFITPSKDWP